MACAIIMLSEIRFPATFFSRVFCEDSHCLTMRQCLYICNREVSFEQCPPSRGGLYCKLDKLFHSIMMAPVDSMVALTALCTTLALARIDIREGEKALDTGEYPSQTPAPPTPRQFKAESSHLVRIRYEEWIPWHFSALPTRIINALWAILGIKPEEQRRGRWRCWKRILEMEGLDCMRRSRFSSRATESL